MAALISCGSVEQKNSGNKKNLKIIVEVVPEGDNSYSISWKDTVGQSAGYRLINRPSEVWCFVMDISDTVGYYRGLSTPADYTYFSTNDTAVNVVFLIGPAILSKQKDKSIQRESETVVEFNPITLDLKSKLRQPIEFVLKERRKLPLTSAL
ncbi:MAG: hypothetical protein ACXWV2_02205 [Chitinophagaceae bacterium]